MDSVNSSDIIEKAIPGILENLDPHTAYIPAKNMKEVQEEIQGNFSGIGVQFSKMCIRDSSNAIRNFIYSYALENHLQFFDIRQQTGFLRTLIIRTSSSGEVMVILSFFRKHDTEIKNLLNAIRDKFPEITSLQYVINQKGNDTITDQEIILHAGRAFIYEEMEDLRFKISPKSFYQTNSEQAYQLYKIALQFAGLTGSETVYDLYTGTGTIANFISRHAKKVIGIEYIPEAIGDAIRCV